jgi:hypothetical protein
VPAAGSEFALIPPDNATGNFTKIVWRFTVRIRFDRRDANAVLARPGMSVETAVAVATADGATPAELGKRVGCAFDRAKDVVERTLAREGVREWRLQRHTASALIRQAQRHCRPPGPLERLASVAPAGGPSIPERRNAIAFLPRRPGAVDGRFRDIVRGTCRCGSMTIANRGGIQAARANGSHAGLVR